MTRKSDEKYLADIIQYGREAIALAASVREERFWHDRTVQLALAHLVQIVGEAAYQISETTRAAVPSVPWPKIIGMRHRLVHGYVDVAYDVVWKVVVNDLPDLIAALEEFTPPAPPSA